MTRFSTLFLWIWCFQNLGGGAHSYLLDFLYGRGPCGGAENKEAELECQGNILYEKAGIQQQTGLAKSVAIEQGERALRCAASIGGIDLDKKLSVLGPFGFAKRMVFEQYFNALKDSSQIETLCNIAQVRNSNRRKLKGEQKHSGSGGTGGRRLGTPTAVQYPAQTSASYAAWAESYLGSYLVGGDSSTYTDVEEVSSQLLGPIDTLQGEVIDDTLSLSKAALEVVCNVFGVVEVGFDPGDACRIIPSSINLAIVINEVALLELRLDLERAQMHDSLIGYAQLEATYTDSALLVTNLT